MNYRPLFGTAPSFGEAFPGVKSLRLTGTQNGEVGHENQRDIYYSNSNLPQTIPCSNPRCKQGGFNLRATIITVTHSKLLSFEEKLYCNGHEGTAKGRIKGAPCFNTLSFKMEVTYSDN